MKKGEDNIASKKITKYIQTYMSEEYISEEIKQQKRKLSLKIGTVIQYEHAKKCILNKIRVQRIINT